MRVFNTNILVSEIVDGCEGFLELVHDQLLDNVSELSEATKSSLCFYENEKYLSDLVNSAAGLVVVPNNFDKNILPNNNLFFTEKPYLAFNSLVYRWINAEKLLKSNVLHNDGSLLEKSGLNHPTSTIGSNCRLHKNITLKMNVVIGDNVQIGKNTIIEANTVIGDSVQIGNDCHIHSNTTIYADTIIKDRVSIHAGCVIGSDGFGYIYSDNKHQKIYHLGKVLIEDDVEIGANTTIDRGTLGVTKIGRGTKIDNLVQIGHNCSIGSNSILCAQVGLAGNTEIGDGVYLAGQVGAAGHLKIGDGVMVGAQSGISGDIPPGKKYFGTPAIDAGLQKRIIVSLKRLPEMLRYFNKQKK